MNTSTTVPITDARKNIYHIADAVQVPGTYYTLTEKGRPKAVIMSAEDFDSWQETLMVMEQFPDLSNEIAKIDQDISSGKGTKYPTLEEVMAENGFVVMDKKNNHAMDNTLRKTGKKRAQ